MKRYRLIDIPMFLSWNLLTIPMETYGSSALLTFHTVQVAVMYKEYQRNLLGRHLWVCCTGFHKVYLALLHGKSLLLNTPFSELNADSETIRIRDPYMDSAPILWSLCHLMVINLSELECTSVTDTFSILM